MFNELNNLCKEIYKGNKERGFWEDPNLGQKAALVHGEVSEFVEAIRLPELAIDKHLPQYENASVELADIVIRVLDLAGYLDVPLGDVIRDKLAFNATRPYKHGKLF